MFGKQFFGLVWMTSLGIIIIVDYIIGPTAEYINAWEIVRRTFAPEKSPSLHQYLFCQDFFGPMALTAGWVLFLIEGLLFSLIVWGIGMTAHHWLQREKADGDFP